MCFEPWHRAAWVPADDKSPNLRVRHPVKLCARFESLRDSRRLKVRLECYSDSKADERPVRFYLGEQLRMVGEILDPGRGQTTFFSKFGQMMATCTSCVRTTPPRRAMDRESFSRTWSLPSRWTDTGDCADRRVVGERLAAIVFLRPSLQMHVGAKPGDHPRVGFGRSYSGHLLVGLDPRQATTSRRLGRLCERRHQAAKSILGLSKRPVTGSERPV